jgi:hypothetical protein
MKVLKNLCILISRNEENIVEELWPVEVELKQDFKR